MRCINPKHGKEQRGTTHTLAKITGSRGMDRIMLVVPEVQDRPVVRALGDSS